MAVGGRSSLGTQPALQPAQGSRDRVLPGMETPRAGGEGAVEDPWLGSALKAFSHISDSTIH